MDASGNVVSNQDSIKVGVVSFFSNLYKDMKPNNIMEQLVVLKKFPSFVNEEEELTIGSPIDIMEVESSLKAFSKDKSPRPNDWPAKFYIHFFDIMGVNIVATIEETRVLGIIPENLNTT